MGKTYNVIDKLCESKFHAAQGMIMFGAPFIAALGHTLEKADMNNTIKIYKHFKSEWFNHEDLYLKWLASQPENRAVSRHHRLSP